MVILFRIDSHENWVVDGEKIDSLCKAKTLKSMRVL